MSVRVAGGAFSFSHVGVKHLPPPPPHLLLVLRLQSISRLEEIQHMQQLTRMTGCCFLLLLLLRCCLLEFIFPFWDLHLFCPLSFVSKKGEKEFKTFRCSFSIIDASAARAIIFVFDFVSGLALEMRSYIVVAIAS